MHVSQANLEQGSGVTLIQIPLHMSRRDCQSSLLMPASNSDMELAENKSIHFEDDRTRDQNQPIRGWELKLQEGWCFLFLIWTMGDTQTKAQHKFLTSPEAPLHKPTNSPGELIL